MKYTCVLIVVEDIRRARHFYETILGQKVQSDYGENVAFEGGFAIHEKTHFQNLINGKPITLNSHSFELYFEDDDLVVIEKRLKDNNVDFIHGIIEQPWKQRVMRFYDHDKNIIEIGERLEHLACRLYQEKYQIDEISKVTYLSKEIVESIIKQHC